MPDIESMISDIIDGSGLITPGNLVKIISAARPIPKKEIASVIKALISEGRLTYSNDHGHTFLVKSVNVPVRVSEHVILRPPQLTAASNADDVVITIESGASFGNGQHPTTRLAIRGLDYLFSKRHFARKGALLTALDIGTGSGVLAIAALKMGISRAVGTDIDPCARYEAEKNARHNGVENCFSIRTSDICELHDVFDLILANLRYPTLLSLCEQIGQMTTPDGAVVISGVKSDERTALIDYYSQNRFLCIWEDTEKEWTGFVFIKG